MSGGRETEIKLAMASAKACRDLLRHDGFRVFRRRVFESNAVFDTADATLRKTGRLLRIREAARKATLTYKSAARPGRYKSRQEIEMQVSNAAAATALFKNLGFLPLFRYEKYRTEFHRPADSGIAMLDETPIGVYLELEGAPRWIDTTARRLGFTRRDYITDSYGRLYFMSCEARGVHPTNMVFDH